MVTVKYSASRRGIADGEHFDRSAVLGLVADVGGTHIRFGIAVGGSSDPHSARRPLRAALRRPRP